MNENVNKWIDDHKEELLNDIKELCSIPSVNSDPEGDMPFGKKPYRALSKALELCKSYGFSVTNYDNYVGAADLDPSLDRYLDVLGHTDVVPAGEGWTVTEPFNIIEKDNRLYGRGTSDDKGPLLCALYAMRAIKECKVPIKKGVRAIIGSDEETGSLDIAHYYEKEPEAELTFSPDAEFPLINIEKGQFRVTFGKKFKEDPLLPRIKSLKAGIALNAVPQKAELVLEGYDMKLARRAIEEIEKECKVKIEAEGEKITVIGESAHASTPELGKNAGLAAVMLASRLPLHESEAFKLLKKIPLLFPYGITDGSGIGIKMEDEESHALTCTLDLFNVTPGEISFSFDARTPVMANDENCRLVAEETIKKAGFDSFEGKMVPPHVVPSDSEFVKKLLGAYEDVTGLKGYTVAIGGGTYCHDIKNGVAFGAVLPGRDTRMHGADEFFDIDNIMLATKVYAEAMIRLLV